MGGTVATAVAVAAVAVVETRVVTRIGRWAAVARGGWCMQKLVTESMRSAAVGAVQGAAMG